MEVICANCGLQISTIVESSSSKLVNKKVRCVRCLNEFYIDYPTGSRHFFYKGAVWSEAGINFVGSANVVGVDNPKPDDSEQS